MARFSFVLLFSLFFSSAYGFLGIDFGEDESPEYVPNSNGSDLCFDDDEEQVECKTEGDCHNVGSVITVDVDHFPVGKGLHVKSIPMIYATASSATAKDKSHIKRVAKGCMVIYSTDVQKAGYVRRVFVLKSSLLTWVMVMADETFFYKIGEKLEHISEEEYFNDISRFNDVLNEELQRRGYNFVFNIKSMAKTGYISPESTHVFMPTAA